MREDPMLVVVSYGGGRKGFIGLFLGFLFALGVLDLVGQEEEEESMGVFIQFFFFCGLDGPQLGGLDF